MTRVTPSEAMSLLCQHGAEPMQAAADLTNAVHTRADFRVWCNGVIVKPHMRPDIRVVARLKDDGRWTAEVESISNTWPGHCYYRWEFEADEILLDERVPPYLQKVMSALAKLPERTPYKEAEKKLQDLGLKLSRSTWSRAKKLI